MSITFGADRARNPKTLRFMEGLRDQLSAGEYLVLITPFVDRLDSIGRLSMTLDGADSSYSPMSASAQGVLVGLSALDECWNNDGFIIVQRTDSAFASAVGWRIMDGEAQPMSAEQAGRDMPSGVMYADAPYIAL